MKVVSPLKKSLFRFILFWKDPNDMSALDSHKGRLKECVPLGIQDRDIGQRQESFIPIQFILDALVAAYVKASTHQVRGRLNSSIDSYLGDDICKDLAFIIVFNGHITSLEGGVFQMVFLLAALGTRCLEQ
jgi:hypothetical protein